jgi:hypothetical protein
VDEVKPMANEPAPVVLELAPLPRDQLGPFLLLGLPKEADKDAVEANWAERVKRARKNQFKMPLEDINWAREVINDPEKRFRFASSSLNLDTAEAALERLAQTYGLRDASRPSWKPYDSERALADYTPALPVPDPQAIGPTIPLPELPLELPAVAWLLQQFLPESLDPWVAVSSALSAVSQTSDAGG